VCGSGISYTLPEAHPHDSSLPESLPESRPSESTLSESSPEFLLSMSDDENRVEIEENVVPPPLKLAHPFECSLPPSLPESRPSVSFEASFEDGDECLVESDSKDDDSVVGEDADRVPCPFCHLSYMIKKAGYLRSHGRPPCAGSGIRVIVPSASQNYRKELFHSSSPMPTPSFASAASASGAVPLGQHVPIQLFILSVAQDG